jgi:hypothetical protein
MGLGNELGETLVSIGDRRRGFDRSLPLPALSNATRLAVARSQGSLQIGCHFSPVPTLELTSMTGQSASARIASQWSAV